MSSAIEKQALSQLLAECYHDATRKDGLIDFVTEVRPSKNDYKGKYSISQHDLAHLFSDKVWKEAKHAGGHRKLNNCITDIVIEYKNHGNDGGIDPGAAQDICDQVQKHLNILCNDIFGYKMNNWKLPPNYQSSVGRYMEWSKNKG